jgi:hypothetical protein
MANPIQDYDLSVLQEGAGDSWGNPLASAKTVGINVKEIASIDVDTTTVAGANSRITMKPAAGNLPRVFWSATTQADLQTAINA